MAQRVHTRGRIWGLRLTRFSSGASSAKNTSFTTEPVMSDKSITFPRRSSILGAIRRMRRDEEVKKEAKERERERERTGKRRALKKKRGRERRWKERWSNRSVNATGSQLSDLARFNQFTPLCDVSFAFRLSRIGPRAPPGRGRLISEIIARPLSFCNVCMCVRVYRLVWLINGFMYARRGEKSIRPAILSAIPSIPGGRRLHTRGSAFRMG